MGFLLSMVLWDNMVKKERKETVNETKKEELTNTFFQIAGEFDVRNQ